GGLRDRRRADRARREDRDAVRRGESRPARVRPARRVRRPARERRSAHRLRWRDPRLHRRAARAHRTGGERRCALPALAGPRARRGAPQDRRVRDLGARGPSARTRLGRALVTDAIWTRPSWRAEADAWISAQLERLGLSRVGAVVQPYVQPWSTVLRVPTSSGDLYFKASAPVQAFEVPLLERLVELYPDRLPPVLAFDSDRAWMLMRDAGTLIRELVKTRRDVHHWLTVVPLYAEVQIGAAPLADDLLDLGVP